MGRVALTICRCLIRRGVRRRLTRLRRGFRRSKRLTLTGRCTRVCHVILRLFSGFIRLLKRRRVPLGRCYRLLSTKLRRTGMNIVPPDLSRIIVKSVREAHVGGVHTLFFIKTGSALLPKGTKTENLLSRQSEGRFRRGGVGLSPKPGRGLCVRGFCLCVGLAGPSRLLCLS